MAADYQPDLTHAREADSPGDTYFFFFFAPRVPATDNRFRDPQEALSPRYRHVSANSTVAASIDTDGTNQVSPSLPLFPAAGVVR